MAQLVALQISLCRVFTTTVRPSAYCRRGPRRHEKSRGADEEGEWTLGNVGKLARLRPAQLLDKKLIKRLVKFRKPSTYVAEVFFRRLREWADGGREMGCSWLTNELKIT